MADDPTPQDPPKDPDPAPSDPPPADPPKDPEPPADPPKEEPPAPVPPDEDVVATRAENERLKAELEELKKKPKAPAPPKRTTEVKPQADPKAEPVEVKGKRRRRVSRLLGDHYDGDDDE